MSFFQMPSVPPHDNLHNELYATFQGNLQTKASRTFIRYLNSLKTRIGDNQLGWVKYKKYTNPYEFIHTSVPNTTQSISRLSPLSRSYYKMIEICNTFDLFQIQKPIKTFHLAEGPGGFIEALCHLRNNPTDTYYGMTLIDESNTNVPGWNKTDIFLNSNPTVNIETGVTQTGDITAPDNLLYCHHKYKATMDFITGDAGIDYSFDFNLQEHVSAKLIICQVAFACAMLKKGGAFTMKVFDISTPLSIDTIYFLSLVFETVHIFKPHTSRYANSERYVVCQEFRISDSTFLVQFFHSIMNHSVSRLFVHEIPYMYLNKLEEHNAIIGQQQIENILSTLSLIENPKPQKLDVMKRRNIGLCIKWCEKHNVPKYDSLQHKNLFTEESVAL